MHPSPSSASHSSPKERPASPLWAAKRQAVAAESTVAAHVPVIEKPERTKALIGACLCCPQVLQGSCMARSRHHEHMQRCHSCHTYLVPPICAGAAIKDNLLCQDLPPAALEVIINSMTSMSFKAGADIIQQVSKAPAAALLLDVPQH